MKIHKLESDKKKPKGFSIPVYWIMCGTKDVYRSYAVSVTDTTINLSDGSWMPVKNCYLTPEQALASINVDAIIYEERFEKAAKNLRKRIKAALLTAMDDFFGSATQIYE